MNADVQTGQGAPVAVPVLLGILLSLGLLVAMAASGIKLPDAKTTTKSVAATLIGLLVTLVGLAFAGAALWRGRLAFATLGLVVFVSGTSLLSTTLGLPEHLQGLADTINQLIALINHVLHLINRILDWLLK